MILHSLQATASALQLRSSVGNELVSIFGTKTTKNAFHDHSREKLLRCAHSLDSSLAAILHISQPDGCFVREGRGMAAPNNENGLSNCIKKETCHWEKNECERPVATKTGWHGSSSHDDECVRAGTANHFFQ